MPHAATARQPDAARLPAIARLAAATAATAYGFVPTGAVALACAAAAAARAARGADPAPFDRRADAWLTATLFIGAAVELPVILAAL